MALRLLVLDAYAPEGRAAVRDAGGTEAGELYRRMLGRLAPGSEVEIGYPADPDPALPGAAEISRYDGIAWTGSSLTIHDRDDRRVTRQIAFARDVYEVGVPSFGSCWAAQIAVVAAGGRCAASPRGREFGVSREISTNEAGRAHPLYAGKAARFDAFTSHADEVVELPPGATLLASNAWSRVQGVAVQHRAGRFWAVQYHPEYDLHEVASLCRLRRHELVAQGTFESEAAAQDWIEHAERLHETPDDADRRRALAVDDTVLDRGVREHEVARWLASLAT